MKNVNSTFAERLARITLRAGVAILALVVFLGTAQSVRAAALTVSVMPSYTQNPSQGNAALNEQIQVWGRVYGGSGTYATYSIDFGDGSAAATGSIDNTETLPKAVAQDGSLAIPAYIGTAHAYATAGSKTVTLTVTDSLGATASKTATLRVRQAPTHEDRVNIAVENGLRYLYLAQTPRELNRCYWTANDNQYGWASSSLALMAFEENGHLAVNDPALDVYAESVQRGINNLVSVSVSQNIKAQNGQVTDTNGNGRGIYVGSGNIYDHCLAALAIIGAYPGKAAAQAAAIPYDSIGVPRANFPGVTTFYDFCVDMMDTLFWCQSDGDIRGWRYSVHDADSGGIDGSTHQWPNMVFAAVKDRWGVAPPAWVLTNSMNAYVALQDHRDDPSTNFGHGGCGYDSASAWRNNGKTGGMLAAYNLGGKMVGTDLDATIGYDFIGRTWITPPSDGSGVDINSGWPGNWYYMYALKKGLQLQNVATVTAQYDDNNSGPRDWYADLSAWLIGDAALLDAPQVNNPKNVQISPDLRTRDSMFGQFPDGHWEGHAWPSHNGYPVIQTAGAILTLSESITVAVPVAVIAPVPDQSARKPASFQLDGSASYDLDSSGSLVEWLWKFDAGPNPDWSHPDAVGQKPTVNPGWNAESVHTVSLRVKDNQNPAQYGTATAKVKVTIDDHHPVAVPLPPSQIPQVYAGKIGATVQLDGTASYDVDGDSIVSYAWDLNGDGIYGDAADAALDTSGAQAHGAKASLVFGTPHTGVVGLQVGSQAAGAGPLYSDNQAAIDIYASASDLSVQSFSVTKSTPGSSADVHAVLKNDAASANGFSAVLVRFYNGDPYGTGAQIGGNQFVNLPVGGTATLDVHLPLSLGQQLIYLKVDANNVIPEWNEQNNVAGISVLFGGNLAPVAKVKNVVVIADASGSASASIDDGSYDPDGDTITLKQTPAGPYPIGVTSVTLLVTDSQGASSQGKATVTVLDRKAPTLTLPADIVVNTDRGQSTAVVNYTVSAKDAVAGVKLITDVPSGTAFPIGTTIVTATAKDPAGNAISGSFTVTVKDGEAPVITAYDLAVAATSDAGAVVNYPAATVIDNVGVASVTYSQASGTAFPMGVTTVTITAQDAAGNVATGQFSVRVVKTLPPRAVQPTAPKVVGMTLAQAQTALANAKLWAGAVTTAASATVPAGSVVSQSPAAGASVPPDSIISLVVSLGAPIRVPSVVGLAEPKAQALLAAAHLRAGFVAKVNSTTVPVGNVVTQFPAAGAMASPGSAVDLTESFGAGAVAVPNVVGLAQAQAEKTITAAGLIFGVTATATSATVPAGLVISETPVGGTTVAPGSAVQITVSLGAAIAVPSVVGLPQSQAQAALLGSNLAVGTISKANSEAVPAGNVISQGTPAGTSVPQGSLVNLVVSLGAPVVKVPNVVGLTEAKAQAAIFAAKLTVSAEIMASSATVAAGNVMSQSPAYGATAPQGSGMTLTISAGSKQTGVPSVVGLTQARAQAALVAAKLTTGAITNANSLTVAAGNVISQDPAAGTIAPTSTAVALVLSLGPPPVTVPDLAGKTQAQAQSALAVAKLTFGAIATASSSTVAAGNVMSQSPVAGATVPQGSAVDFTVSAGPAVAVPNVVGLPQSQASTTIAAAKLAVGSATKASSATIPTGNVISQGPLAGAMVAQNSAVNLVISLGPPLATVPNVVGLPQAQAQANLVTATLSMGPLTSVTSATVPLGNVISQSPTVGTTVAQGSAVNLTVSLGPPVKVPSVVGLVQAQAQTNITTANLGVGTVTTAHSTTVAAGKVISQVPAGGSTAAKGSSVNLVVSSGATSGTVPNVVGLAQADAGTAIVAAGFTLGTVTPGISATIPAGQVYGQSPTPGTVVAAPSPVNITVSAGPGNTVVPDLAGLTPPQAKSALFPAQLVLGTVTLSPSSTVPAGRISGQSPAAGATATQGAAVSVTVSVGPFVDDGTAPVVTIQSPENNSTVTSLTDVIATVSDAHLAFYQVDVARADKVDLANTAADNPNFTLLAQGATNVNNAKVATFDPTNLANDSYVLRVRGFDQGGHIYAIHSVVNVSGNAKLGRFALDFTDLSVPLVGIPIQIVRHYDSFSASTSGDFGYGWSLGSRDAQIRALLQPSFAGPTLAPDSRLYLTTPDGRRVGFTAKFDVLSQFIGTIVQVNFKPDPGVYETVEILDGNQTYLSSGVFLGGLLGSEVYVPKKYRLTLKDGTKYDYDTTAGLQKITDLNGNTVTFTANAIAHSSGQSITLKRDAQNRITSITDPAGKAVTYTYSAQGDLIAFTDLAGVSFRYAYKAAPSHYLETMLDPLGRTAVRTEFDGTGRVTSIIDGNGVRHAQSFDPGSFTGTQTDGRGNVTNLLYDASGNLTKVISPTGGTIVYTYNANSQIASISDQNNHTTVFSYDGGGNTTEIKDAKNQKQAFTYDISNRLESETDQLGRVTRYEYDVRGNLTEISDSAGYVRTATYDSLGRQTTATDRNGNTTTLQYTSGALPSRIVHPDGTAQQFVSGPHGQPTRATDENGHSTVMDYDGDGKLVKITQANNATTIFQYSGKQLISITNPLGRAIAFGYDAAAQKTSQTDSSGTRRFAYDNDGHLISESDQLDRRTFYAYREDGKQIAVVDAAGGTTNFAYDLVGNLLSRKDARGNVTAYTYDELNRTVTETDPTGRIKAYGYDAVGNRTSSRDEKGNSTLYQYDRLNRLVSVTSPLGAKRTLEYDPNGNIIRETDPLGGITERTYDSQDRLLAIKDAEGGLVKYAYDGVGNRTSVTDPLLNKTTFVYDEVNLLASETNPLGKSRTFKHDLVGNVTERVDRNGRKRTFAYDDMNHLSREEWWSGSTNVRTINFSFDAVGNKRTAADLDSRYVYSYDSLNRLISTDNGESPAASHVVLQFGYDAVGNRTSVSDNAGVTIASIYDARDLLSRKTWQGGEVSPAHVDFAYDERGNHLQTKRFSDLEGTQAVGESLFVYDEDGRLTNARHAARGATIADYSYTYDLKGRVTQEKDQLETKTYSYDRADQLLNAIRSVQPSETYRYDVSGNRTGSGIVVTTANRIKDDGAFDCAYDEEGNLISTVEHNSNIKVTLSYDHRNRLTSVVKTNPAKVNLSTVQFTYDVENHRIAKLVDGKTTRFAYDDETPWADFDGDGSTLVRYLGSDMIDSLVARHRALDGTNWYLSDRLGSIRDITNANGESIVRRDFESFGRLLKETNPNAGDRFKFNGRELDSETNLYYYRARYLSPNSGRFISEDPLGFEAGDTNMFRYVRNNASNATDPYGTQIALEYDELSIPGIEFAESQSFTARASTFIRTGGSRIGSFASENKVEISVVTVGSGLATYLFHNYTLLGAVLHIGSFADSLDNGRIKSVERKSEGAAPVGGAPPGDPDDDKPSKANSPIWKNLKNFRNKTKTDGTKFYEWDYTHGDIEVYNSNGRHLGSMDPKTGQMTKPGVPGRTIKL